MMKKNARNFELMAMFLSLIILYCTAAASASAAEENLFPEIDTDRKGSIFITLAEESGKTPTDGRLLLVSMDVLKNYYESMDDESYEDVMEKIRGTAESEWIELLRTFGTEVEIDSNGSAGFYNLPFGSYMILQTVPSSGYYAISSFNVKIPMFEDGEWIYDIDASPKTEPLRPVPEPELPPGNPEPEIIPPEEPETEAADNGGLPQTGQLNWPIPLLAGGGLLLVVIGLVLSMRKKDRHAS